MKKLFPIVLMFSLVACLNPENKTTHLDVRELNPSDKSKNQSNYTPTNSYKIKLKKGLEEKDLAISLANLKKVSNRLIGFDYPELEAELINKNKIILSNDSIEIEIKTRKFNEDKHKVVYDKKTKEILKIDGRKAIGVSKELPEKEITSIKVLVHGDELKLSRKNFSNLYNLRLNCQEEEEEQLCSAKAYVNNRKEIILWMRSGKGKERYDSFLFFKDGQFHKRLVGEQK